MLTPNNPARPNTFAAVPARPQHTHMAQKAHAAFTHPLTEPAPPDAEALDQAKRVAGLIIEQLTRLGITHQNQDGEMQTVRLREVSIAIQPDGRVWAYFSVDTNRLPHGRRVDDLTSESVLRHLSAACQQAIGHELVLANPDLGGVTYLTWLHRVAAIRPAPQLPKQATLNMESRPEGDWLMPLGLAAEGPRWFSAGGQGHILVVGQTGSGKSTWMKTALAALISREKAETLRLAIIDPKRMEFAQWRRLNHLIAPVVSEVDEATELLESIAREMDERSTRIANALFNDFRKYNTDARKRGQPTLPLIVVVFDEFIDLIEQSRLGKTRSKLESLLIQLVTKGRAAGIVLMLGTAEAKGEVVNTTLRRNCSYRVCFRVAEAAASHMVLGEAGAESLRVAGRLLARIEGERIEAQGYYIEDAKLADLVTQASEPQTDEDEEALDPLTLRLARFSIAHMDGEFAVNRLFEGINKDVISDHADYVVKNQIELIGRVLEGKNLLQFATKPGDPKRRKVRMVTTELRAMVSTASTDGNG